MKRLTGVLIVLATAIFLLSGYYFIEAWRFTTNSVQTQGEIISFISKPSHANLHKAKLRNYPVVQFKTQQDQVISFTGQHGYSSRGFNIGDRVDVIYHPHNPQHASLGNSTACWWRFIFIFFAALILTILACINHSRS